MLLVDDDEPEPLDRREHRRARPDAHSRLAAAHAKPLVAALARAQPRVEHRDPVAEARLEPRHRLRREPDLRHEHDHAAAPLERRLGGGQVHLGLARAGDAVEEKLAALPVEPAVIRSSAACCGGVEHRALAAGPDRHRHRPARDLRLGELDKAARLEALERVAIGSGRDRPVRGRQALERGALLRPQPLGAAERVAPARA